MKPTLLTAPKIIVHRLGSPRPHRSPGRSDHLTGFLLRAGLLLLLAGAVLSSAALP